jgi:hypothetical protein
LGDSYKDGSDALAGAVWQACENANLDLEIDANIIGIGDDWEDYEMSEAIEDDIRAETDSRLRRAQVTVSDQEVDINWSMI